MPFKQGKEAVNASLFCTKLWCWYAKVKGFFVGNLGIYNIRVIKLWKTFVHGCLVSCGLVYYWNINIGYKCTFWDP